MGSGTEGVGERACSASDLKVAPAPVSACRITSAREIGGGRGRLGGDVGSACRTTSAREILGDRWRCGEMWGDMKSACRTTGAREIGEEMGEMGGSLESACRTMPLDADEYMKASISAAAALALVRYGACAARAAWTSKQTRVTPLPVSDRSP